MDEGGRGRDRQRAPELRCGCRGGARHEGDPHWSTRDRRSGRRRRRKDRGRRSLPRREPRPRRSPPTSRTSSGPRSPGSNAPAADRCCSSAHPRRRLPCLATSRPCPSNRTDSTSRSTRSSTVSGPSGRGGRARPRGAVRAEPSPSACGVIPAAARPKDCSPGCAPSPRPAPGTPAPLAVSAPGVVESLLEHKIDDARKQAEEHGTIPDPDEPEVEDEPGDPVGIPEKEEISSEGR